MEPDKHAGVLEVKSIENLAKKLSQTVTQLELKEEANHALLVKIDELRTVNLIQADKIEHLEHLLEFFTTEHETKLP